MRVTTVEVLRFGTHLLTRDAFSLSDTYFMRQINWVVVDPMHNLYQGTAKWFWKTLEKLGVLKPAILLALDNAVNDLHRPPGLPRMRHKIRSGFSHMTAADWRTWTHFYSEYAMAVAQIDKRYIVVWRMFVTACRKMCVGTIDWDEVGAPGRATSKDIPDAKALLRSFCHHCSMLADSKDMKEDHSLDRHSLTPGWASEFGDAEALAATAAADAKDAGENKDDADRHQNDDHIESEHDEQAEDVEVEAIARKRGPLRDTSAADEPRHSVPPLRDAASSRAGYTMNSPNMHSHQHLVDIVTEFGTAQAFWAWGMERQHAFLKRTPTNRHDIEAQVMKKCLLFSSIRANTFDSEANTSWFKLRWLIADWIRYRNDATHGIKASGCEALPQTKEHMSPGKGSFVFPFSATEYKESKVPVAEPARSGDIPAPKKQPVDIVMAKPWEELLLKHCEDYHLVPPAADKVCTFTTLWMGSTKFVAALRTREELQRCMERTTRLSPKRRRDKKEIGSGLHDLFQHGGGPHLARSRTCFWLHADANTQELGCGQILRFLQFEVVTRARPPRSPAHLAVDRRVERAKQWSISRCLSPVHSP